MPFLRVKGNQLGSILVLVLWSLGFLTVLAIALSVQIRQKLTFLSRIEVRDQLQRISEAGALKAVAVLNQDIKLNGEQLTPPSKAVRHNNSQQFSDIAITDGKCTVEYQNPDGVVDSPPYYGMMDEESKLNINKVDARMLTALIKHVAGLKDEDAENLGRAIVDWRQEHSSELTGFYSEDFYENLQYPYPLKHADYEVLDELLLVRGMNQQIFDALKNYVTVYGDGKINVNTAPRVVLLSLGLESAVVDKVLSVRRGSDGIEATADDFIFERPYDVASDVKAHEETKDEEVAQLDQPDIKEWFGTNSRYYRIESIGTLRGAEGRVLCVYDSNSGKIDYWKED